MFSIGIYECDFICVNERYFSLFVCLYIYIMIIEINLTVTM